MRNITTKVLTNNNMPRRSISPIELLLNLRRDVFLDRILLEGGSGDVDGFLLHVVCHVDVLDDGLWEGLFADCCAAGGAGGAVGFGAATGHGGGGVGHGRCWCWWWGLNLEVEVEGKWREKELMRRKMGRVGRWLDCPSLFTLWLFP